MPNARSNFHNVDHQIVKLTFYTSGVENMTLYQTQENSISGPEGTTYRFAWKTRDETISDEEMQQYGANASYGEDFRFGTPRGRIP